MTNTHNEDNLNILLMNTNTGLIKLDNDSVDADWNTAIDVVDYPVHIVNAFYKDEDEFVNANGTTNTGRDKHFNLVVVDRFRNGEKEAIATVTGQYGTVDTASLYSEFRNQLNEKNIKHRVDSVFVSGNGGFQTLNVEFPDKVDLVGGDDIVLSTYLDTSVDGTKSHNLGIRATNKKGKITMNIAGISHKLSARHTTTIETRTTNFIPTINNIIDEWEMIINTMQLMFNNKYDRSFALQLIGDIAEDAGFGERHQSAIVSLYESGAIRTNDDSDSLYRVATALNQYVEDEFEDKKELQSRFRDSVAKSVAKEASNIKTV